MDLNLVHLFMAIYRQRNLTRAGESLGVTRPAVSAGLRRLRDEFQDPLFLRRAHGVEPTIRATAMAEKLELALILIEEAAKPPGEFDPTQENREFVVGMSDYGVAVILPALLQRLRQEAPNITLAVRHPGNEGARKALDGGTFDLLIGNVQESLERIRQQKLLSECFAGLVDQSHPLTNKTFTPEELNKYPALLTEGPANDRWWEHENIRATGYVPRQVFSIPVFLGVALLLKDSPLICVTAERLRRIFMAAYPVTEIPLPFGDQTIIVRQYWHERWHADPAHRWLRQTIHDVCRTL